jgi:MOSC domain-containing protein YiiM
MGTVESIYITDDAAAPTKSIGAAHAVPGVGLDGDRYALKRGTFYEPLPDRELTLIEAEAIEAFRREYGVEFSLGDARRNIVTRGVALNDLVGKEFTVGNVRIRGIRLCEPCDFLQKLTGKPVLKGLLHKGGLRAQILTEGTIQVGAQVKEVEPDSNREESRYREK